MQLKECFGACVRAAAAPSVFSVSLGVRNVEALIIRIGFWGVPDYLIIRIV